MQMIKKLSGLAVPFALVLSGCTALTENHNPHAADTVARTPEPMPQQIIPTGKKVIVIDPNKLAWGAYNSEGSLLREGRASGGSSWCADIGKSCKTAAGVFKVFRKGDVHCKSSKYPLPNGGAEMPHCMFFAGGMAIHGSNYVPNHNASHGCVRVHPGDAEWLHGHFVDIGTEVHVKPY